MHIYIYISTHTHTFTSRASDRNSQNRPGTQLFLKNITKITFSNFSQTLSIGNNVHPTEILKLRLCVDFT